MIHTIDPLHDGSSNFGSRISYFSLSLAGFGPFLRMCVGGGGGGGDEAVFSNLFPFYDNGEQCRIVKDMQ